MPEEIKRAFQKEYGKKEGTRIFYAWENKHKKVKLKTRVKRLYKKNKPRLSQFKNALDRAAANWS